MEDIEGSCLVERIENMWSIRLQQKGIGDLLNEFWISGIRDEKECPCQSERMQGLLYKVKSQETAQKNNKIIVKTIRGEESKIREKGLLMIIKMLYL